MIKQENECARVVKDIKNKINFAVVILLLMLSTMELYLPQ